MVSVEDTCWCRMWPMLPIMRPISEGHGYLWEEMTLWWITNSLGQLHTCYCRTWLSMPSVAILIFPYPNNYPPSFSWSLTQPSSPPHLYKGILLTQLNRDFFFFFLIFKVKIIYIKVYNMMIWYTWWNDYCSQANECIYLLTVTFFLLLFCVCVARAPKLYSLSKFPDFGIILLTVVIMYIRSLDLLVLHNSSFVPSDQRLPTSLISHP